VFVLRKEHSQGGDTGSNPVGTTGENSQVTGQSETKSATNRRLVGRSSRNDPVGRRDSAPGASLWRYRIVPVTSRFTHLLAGRRGQRTCPHLQRWRHTLGRACPG
jgi:hypothetical protein